MTAALQARATASLGPRTLTIDVTIEAGEVVALVGPNGAGKSTTLDTLVGLRRLATGRITTDKVLADADAGVDLPPDERGLGWVPQRGLLLPRRDVLAQVAPFARATRAPLLRSQTLLDLLGQLGLGDLLDARPGALSGGQAQRVAVARALAFSNIVLFDEATSAQDPVGAHAIRAAIRAHTAAGGACLVVAHRPEDAWVLADRAVVLEDLSPVQAGTPHDLASRPATAYVAQVAGATVLSGHVDEAHVLHTPDGDLVVGDTVEPGDVVALVRPNAVTLHQSRPEGQSARNLVASTVVALEHAPMGLRVVLAGRPGLTASLTQQAADALDLRVGSQVWASCKATDVEVRPA